MIRPLLSALLVFMVSFALAQDNTPPTIKVTLPSTAKPGAKVKGVVEVTFAEGLHGYQNPPTGDYQIPVKVTLDTKGYVLTVTYPKGVMKAIGGDPNPCGVYEGTVKFPIFVTVPKKAGAATLKITCSYQQCNDQACFPPSTVSATSKIIVKK